MKQLLIVPVLLLVMLTGDLLADPAADMDDLLARKRLVKTLEDAGRLDEALTMAHRSLDATRRVYGQDHREVAMGLDRIASILRKKGRYADSEQYYQQALQLVRRHGQEVPVDLAAALQNLAGLYRGTGRYRDAERHYLEALDTLRRVPADHSQFSHAADAASDISGNLAMLYREQGRYADAEPLLKAAVERASKAAEGDWLSQRMNLSMDGKLLHKASAMMNLAGLYMEMRRIAEAEKLMTDGLAIQRRVLGENDPRVAQGMHNLAAVYLETDRLEQAEPMLAHALKVARQVYGERHPEVATYLDSLAGLYRKRGEYQRALLLSERAVAIAEGTIGAAHLKTAVLRNNLANLYLWTDRYPEAELLLRKTLKDAESNLGTQHPQLATQLVNLASAALAQGKDREVHQLYGRAIAIQERSRDDLFQLFSEEQKLNYIYERMLQVQFYLLHAKYQAETEPQAVRDAFEVWLRWKGIVMESQGRYQEAISRADNPQGKKLFEELSSVRRELAGLRLMQPSSSSVASYRQTVSVLESRKQLLEGELSKTSAVYATDRSVNRAGITSLAAHLPKGAAYIDFALVRDWQFRPLEFKGYRYLAFIYRPDTDRVELIDLGTAGEIDRLITEYREEIGRKSAGDAGHSAVRLEEQGRRLYQKLIVPFKPQLEGVTELVISPDGMLHLVPFEVFVGEDRRFLVEQYTLRYMPSGRDLVRLANTARHRGDLLIMADPDYDLKSGAAKTGHNTVRDLQGVRFSRLPDTRREADMIAALLRGRGGAKVRLLVGAAATEKALFGQQQPGMLHLATHGFFLHGDIKSSAETRGLKVVQVAKTESAGAAATVRNPMLRSGIALTGANSSIENGTDEGFVTAEKILGMRLSGTDLVTLSACETGVGELYDGEGVFGLKRAFIMAGARTVVISLWSVPSRETTELMSEFYRQMAIGVPKARAMRQAQLVMLRKYRHPFYWGAFLLVGSPD